MKGKSEENLEKQGKVIDLSNILNYFGRYQYVQFFLACFPAMFVNLININFVFLAGDVNYRCKIPECDTSPPFDQHPPWWPDAAIDRCSRPMLDPASFSGVCSNTSFTGAVEACTEWVYENNSTMIADLDLACQPWKASLVGTVHNFGTMTSMLIAGWMSDRFGRKPALIVCAIAGCVGHLKPFATSYYMYIAVEYLESFVSGGANAAAMMSMIEISGPKYRLLAGVIFAYAVYLGEFIFAIAAMYIQDWKTLARVIYTPPLFFITYIYFIKESPRWQILNSKTEDAKKALKLIAEMNHINISQEELAKLDDQELKQKFNMEGYTKKESLKKIFGSREILKRLITAFMCRFSASFVYYGLMINSVYLPGNKYTNFMLATVMSFPGELVALYLMNKFGRKKPLICGFLLSGLFCVVTGYIPTEYKWATITCFLLGKMIIAVCFTGAVTYVMELFPTSARGCLLGVGAFASRLGSMLAPLTPLLMTVSPVLPSIFFGGSAILSGFLLTRTPETKDVPLLDTIDQVNASAKKRKQDKENLKAGIENYAYRSDSSYTHEQ
ncbi:organic cation transporter protein [Plutella xylostella]|uniref:organic cation transporter protein n=1 Tax=Plutella xylostella TaxID=51655 RepID=UPI00203283E1|nr:organic cation transporter protein [Plutella xylostella]